ncbi:MAG: GNAT family N-acetyltransferase [Parasphingorhabdus sp.]|uniref:GNAT family N-acetyltransferase n=1 Tax=Parasphingorhabdus sp. TaxID=2709688 RepID=UPI003002BB51
MTEIDVPNGNLAVVITHFEMLQKPSGFEDSSHLTFTTWEHPNLNEYRALFHTVGDDWLWFGRLMQTDGELEAALYDDATEIFKVKDDEDTVGFVELSFRDPEHCEIAYFGLIPAMNGKGLGRSVMAEALKRAWRPGVKRVWLHSCTNDSQRAPAFYQNVGFVAYKRQIDIHPDPRLSGHLPMDAGRHIPIIPPFS